MSQDMITSTTPPLMVVCSGASSITIMVMLAPPQGSAAATVQQIAILLPLLMPLDTRGVAFCCSSYLSPRCLFRNMPTMPWVLHRLLLFQSLASHQLVYICWSLLWCMLSTFRFQCGCHFHLEGSTIEVCTTTVLQGIPGDGERPTP